MHRLTGELPADKGVTEDFKNLLLAHLLTQQSGLAEIHEDM